MQDSLFWPLYIRKLKQAGLRDTRGRRELVRVLDAATAPMSTQEIIDRVTIVHFVSIYRSLHELQRAGIIKTAPQGFKRAYEMSDIFKPHHHHATCELCGSTREIINQPLEELMNELSKEAGLEPTKHYFELFGLCRRCTKAAK